MDDKGFIVIYRSMKTWEWYTETNTKVVFLHLLLNANWEDGNFKGHVIPRGSLVVGRKSLAKDLRLSERQVRTALEHLELTNEITIKTTNRFSIVTIVNWEKYQEKEEETTNKTTNKRPTTSPANDQQNDQQNDQRKLLQLVGLEDITDQQNDQQVDEETTNKTTTIEQYNNKTIEQLKEKNTKKENFDYQEIIDLYHQNCPSLPKVTKITDARKKLINARLKDYSIGELVNAFCVAEASDFLTGRSGKWNGANFDWVMNTNNIVKILEGNYANKQMQSSLTDTQAYAKEHGHQSSSNPDFIDKLEKETREKSKNPYKNYIHGNYDFEQLERELREK